MMVDCGPIGPLIRMMVHCGLAATAKSNDVEIALCIQGLTALGRTGQLPILSDLGSFFISYINLYSGQWAGQWAVLFIII